MKCMPHEFRCPCKQGEDTEFLGVEVKGGSELSDMWELSSGSLEDQENSINC